MSGLIDTIKNLSLARQLAVLGAALIAVIVMGFVVQGATRQPMGLLYSGLDPARSGEILEALEQQNVTYEIRGLSIFVPGSERDKIRFALAQQGLPRQTVSGYELLDDVNGFSVTSQMYSTSYWRAKEGELTRTILAIPGVDSARVHIGANIGTGFTRSRDTKTASVTLSTVHDLSMEQAEAIQYMVALAVSGLKPDAVAVIDSESGIIAGPNASGSRLARASGGELAETLEGKIQRMLEARLGPGNVEISVAVEVSRELQRRSSVSFDPESRVIRQRSTNDLNETSTGGIAGALTVASNLPQAAAPAGEAPESESRSSSETVAYELNETRTETERMPGQVERISIAVLLNESALAGRVGTDGAIAATTTENLIAEFTQLVASAAGLDYERGDSLTVELMPFAVSSSSQDGVSQPSLIERIFEQYFWVGLQSLLLCIVVLALGFGVIRPVLSAGAATEDETSQDETETDLFGLPANEHENDPFVYLREYAEQREEETAALLTEWLDQNPKVKVNE